MYTLGPIPSRCLITRYQAHELVKYPTYKKYDPEYGHFRSVIYDKDGYIACFSPPKSISLDEFKSIPIENCIIEEFIEGTMINVFFDRIWRIATKSVLGAECAFDSHQSFASMFYECMKYHTLSFDDLNKAFTYSFVMQHPNNKIISEVVVPRLVIVAVYEIVGQTIYEHPTTILGQNRYTFSSYEEAECAAQTLNIKGLMIKHDGKRCKIRNTTHENIAKIKGQSTFEYQYLCIRNTPQADVYFSYFPENKIKAPEYETQILNCAQRLFQNYMDCFVHKKKKLGTYLLKTYLYDLHGIYLHTLKPQYITKKVVIDYLNSLHPRRFITLLRLAFQVN